MAEKKILIIDYDAAGLEKLSKLLKTNKYHVVKATDGQAGYEAYVSEKPDLVVLEAMLPKMHGFDLCQKISRESQGRVPVIIVTGLYKGPKYRQEALNGLGASDFFEKPLDTAAFLAAVKRLLHDEDDFEDELPDSNSVIEALSRRGRGPAPSQGRRETGPQRITPMTSLWTRCNSCQRILYKQDILDNLSVCPSCGFHFRVSAEERLQMLFDDGAYEVLDANIHSVDALHFVDLKAYADRIKDNEKKTGLSEAIVTARGMMGGIPVYILAMDFGFLGGSVASVVGEKIARACERALEDGRPVIIVSVSGGMRMQEGMLSLMQMAKSSAAIARLGQARIPFISVLADPTTGGTTASFAMLGDVNVAEPQALIGFAGPRVIEQTIKEKLPKGFQRSEFLLSHGMLDDVVERKALKPYLVKALRLFLNRPQ